MSRIPILAKNLQILASAGTGKTYQLSNRIVGLIARGVEPERIVALTFTRKAAGEFADAVLTKLAAAASDPATAAKLLADLGMQEADFSAALEATVRALPRLTLGTMDSFFARVVRGFQYELGLTGGTFDLLEGPRADAAKDELLAEILGGTFEDGGGEFFHAFRRAMIGREDQKVSEGLRRFVQTWHGRLRTARALAWGPAALSANAREDWESHKHALAARARAGLEHLTYSDKRQRACLEKLIDTLESHTVGSGLLMQASNGVRDSILPGLLESGPHLAARFYKDFTIDGATAVALREALMMLANCEMAAACERTQAVRAVVEVYDGLCEKRLRRRGRLGFDDVKLLMGAWSHSEDARLRREAVDFRLDARYDHWLLDEFQDTSRSDWAGLVPLIDEAVAAEDGSMFVVGDRKQAIYAWRGGEVGLFDELGERYGDGLHSATMVESRRSCPAVLDLVNQVCGDTATMAELFGPVAARWAWQRHVSADTTAGLAGAARVEVMAEKGQGLTRMVALLRELEVGSRSMTCGVLLRTRKQAREVADLLRSENFDVVEEGARQPAKDHPVGLALWHLLLWLADPSNNFAAEVVRMSPLGAVLGAHYGGFWQRGWEGLLERAGQVGFGGMVEELVAEVWSDWSEFGRRRAGEIIAALVVLDAAGGVTPREAADRVGRLEVSQSPGAAAVQVMTIHKSKGLGFDLVIVPELAHESIPSAKHFEVAEAATWMSQVPAQWVRGVLPEMRAAEQRWGDTQRYEAFCTLYVALTRAKRGLYVFLDPPAKSADHDRASLANWMLSVLPAADQAGVVFQSGSPNWYEGFQPLEPTAAKAANLALPAAVQRRERTTPSGHAKAVTTAGLAGARHSSGGMAFGTEVHAAFEQVGWIDEARPVLPQSEVGRRVAELLDVPALRAVFERGARRVELLREQPVEALIDGRWLSGIIDRLHLHRDELGAVVSAEVIDFKTDAVASPAELLERHSGQMAAYRTVLEKAFPGAAVRCLLVSTKLEALIECP
jgi:ATP-dependent exoDNAse (exonuclease V) beta subunit